MAYSGDSLSFAVMYLRAREINVSHINVVLELEKKLFSSQRFRNILFFRNRSSRRNRTSNLAIGVS